MVKEGFEPYIHFYQKFRVYNKKVEGRPQLHYNTISLSLSST